MDNIKRDFRNMGRDGVGWIYLSQEQPEAGSYER